MLGWDLLPWQRLVADVSGELRADGRWNYPMVVLTVPRQVGKTALIFAIMAQRTIRLREHRSWYTAQTGIDARRTFRDDWAPRVADHMAGWRIRRTNGDENLRWPPTHGLIRIFTPVPTALHGSQADMVVLDEAWQLAPELGQDLLQAAIPTQTTRVRRQVWLVSTAGTEESLWMRRWIERGRNADRGVAYFEWSMLDDADPEDESTWKESHPAMNQLVTMEDLRQFRAILGPAGFARAYLNRWPDMPTVLRNGVLEIGTWKSLRNPRAELTGMPCFAADSDPVTHKSTISVCGTGTLADYHFEVVEQKDGTIWLPNRLVELATKHGGFIAADDGGPIGWVAEELERQGQYFHRVRLAEYARACAQLVDAAHAGLVSHLGDAALDQAVLVADRALHGRGAWRWDRKRSHGDISALVAATLAFAGHVDSSAAETSAIY